jgi:hypothetical protein
LAVIKAFRVVAGHIPATSKSIGRAAYNNESVPGGKLENGTIDERVIDLKIIIQLDSCQVEEDKFIETYMLAVRRSIRSIETCPEAKEPSAHEIGPFVVLSQCSIEGSAEDQSANRVSITIIPLDERKKHEIKPERLHDTMS